jgi:hypothetical protein
MSNTPAGQFDFSEINNITRNLPAGMKLGIAKGLIKNIITTFKQFENACEEDAEEVLAQIEALQVKYNKGKEANLATQAAKAASSEKS